MTSVDPAVQVQAAAQLLAECAASCRVPQQAAAVAAAAEAARHAAEVAGAGALLPPPRIPSSTPPASGASTGLIGGWRDENRLQDSTDFASTLEANCRARDCADLRGWLVLNRCLKAYAQKLALAPPRGGATRLLMRC